MGTINGKFYQNPLKTVGGVAETRLTAEKLLKGHNSSKNQSSMTSIKYAHLQVINWKVSSKSLENYRRSCGDKIVSTAGRSDGRTEGRTDGRTHYYSPVRLTSGDKNSYFLWLRDQDPIVQSIVSLTSSL